MQEIQKIQLQKHPSLDQYIQLHDRYFTSVSECLNLIGKYNNGERTYEYATMNNDLMFLSATHAALAPSIGYLQGMSSRTEDTRKITKSKYAINLKEKKEGLLKEHVRMTDSDIDNLSRMLAEDHYVAARDTEIVSRMMTSAWHAIGDFVDILKAATAREYRELHSFTSDNGTRNQ